MTEEQEFKKYNINDEKLKEEVKSTGFLVNDLELFKFEDKKPTTIKVIDEEVLNRETKFGLKYYLKIEVKKKKYYWQMSKGTLKNILDSIDQTKDFNIMLDTQNKLYSVMPLIPEVEEVEVK